MTKNKKSTQNLLNQKGFTLLEILVALFLAVILLATVISGNSNSRQEIEGSLSNIERAIRFSGDEAALRNTLVRIRFLLNKDPQEYVVEYGPNDTFVLPTEAFENLEELSIKEREITDKKIKKLNQKFTRVSEFQDENKTLNEGIRIIGVGTDQSQKLITEFETSIYIYPTGERDNAFIVLGSDTEVISVSVDAYNFNLDRIYVELEDYEDENDMFNQQEKVAKEMYANWLKN
jgi:prepilin-type N-terminal cleavage/methylation domain-containing protein